MRVMPVGADEIMCTHTYICVDEIPGRVPQLLEVEERWSGSIVRCGCNEY